MKSASSAYESGRVETSAGHTFTWGPTASGKTTSIRADLTRDVEGGAEAWIVDPAGGLADWADRAGKYTASIGEARYLLAAAGNRGPQDKPLVVVIEEAPAVFADKRCRELAERALQYARRLRIRFRVSAQIPTLEQFGGSAALRAALTR